MSDTRTTFGEIGYRSFYAAHGHAITAAMERWRDSQELREDWERAVQAGITAYTEQESLILVKPKRSTADERAKAVIAAYNS